VSLPINTLLSVSLRSQPCTDSISSRGNTLAGAGSRINGTPVSEAIVGELQDSV